MNLDSLTNVNLALENESLADKVYNALESAILNMDFKPGDILNEDEIASAFNISRSPVREALLRLEYTDLVVKGRKSRTVAKLTLEKITANYHMWGMTESYVSGLTCKTAVSKDTAEIRNLISQMEQTPALDKQRYRELNYLFHISLTASCPYKELIEMHKHALSRIRWGYRYNFSNYEDHIDFSHTQHRKVLDAYCDRDSALVEKYIREHADDASQRVRNFYARNNLL